MRRGGKFTALDHARIVQEATESVEALRAKANWP
jgi:hypothetical protein